MTHKLGIMGIDQYGTQYNGLEYPRKDLLARLGSTHADKMYRDTKGTPRHCGYIIAGLWIELYDVYEWKET